MVLVQSSKQSLSTFLLECRCRDAVPLGRRRVRSGTKTVSQSKECQIHSTLADMVCTDEGRTREKNFLFSRSWVALTRGRCHTHCTASILPEPEGTPGKHDDHIQHRKCNEVLGPGVKAQDQSPGE